MNYLQRKKLAFMSIVNQIKGFVRTVVGIPPLALPDCVGGTNLINYTISGNSVQDGTPSPENPIEIQSVGDLTTKNLLPNDWEIGFISTTSGANQSSSTYVRTKDYFTLDISKNYYISSDSINTNTTISWYFYDENKNFISRFVSYKNRTIGTSDCNVLIPTNAVFFRLAVLTTDTTIKVQIELGSTATEYEPYGYKIPITVRGKNLLNISGRSLGTSTGTDATTVRNLEFDKYYVGLTRNNIYAPSYVLSNAITGDVVTVEAKIACYGVAFPIKAKPNTTYRISALNDSVIGIGFYTKDGEFIKDGLTYKIITTPENCEIMTIVCAPTVTNTATIYEELQVEEGEIATDYEPYQEPIETAIYLDEPLRKVGDVADYIDFENGKVVRNIGVKKVNFSLYSFDANTNLIYLRCIISDMLKDSLSCMSNKIENFTTFPGSADYNKLMVSGRHFYYFVKAEKDKQYYIDLMAGTEIHYLLEAPTKEIISLPAIPSFKGTTILSPSTTIQPSNMSAIYYSTSKE